MNPWIAYDDLNPKELREEFVRSEPFPHLVLPNFFNPNRMFEVLEALDKVTFYEKHSDLFSFLQTHDLKTVQSDVLRGLYEFLRSQEFTVFMEDVTGFKLSRTDFDLHATVYQDTDYLLCHDDQLDKRKIAFLIYLSDMDDDEGGSLSLFAKKKGKLETVETIIPQFNTLAFFEVSDKSFHQVDEVLAEKQRIAIGGWFYAE